MNEIISRADAKAAGLKDFYTGAPCKNGHDSARSVSTGKCRQCKKDSYRRNFDSVQSRNKEYRDKNRDKLALYIVRYRLENAEKLKDLNRRYVEKNKEKKRKTDLEYRAANQERIAEQKRINYQKNRVEHLEKRRIYVLRNKESVRRAQRENYFKNKAARNASSKLYYENNKHRVVGHRSKRTAQLKAAVYIDDIEFARLFFREASDLAKIRRVFTGSDWALDHMIPLQAKQACGLHTWRNIQVIPKSMNLRKRNRMIWTLPGEWVRDL